MVLQHIPKIIKGTEFEFFYFFIFELGIQRVCCSVFTTSWHVLEGPAFGFLL